MRHALTHAACFPRGMLRNRFFLRCRTIHAVLPMNRVTCWCDGPSHPAPYHASHMQCDIGILLQGPHARNSYVEPRFKVVRPLGGMRTTCSPIVWYPNVWACMYGVACMGSHVWDHMYWRPLYAPQCFQLAQRLITNLRAITNLRLTLIVKLLQKLREI